MIQTKRASGGTLAERAYDKIKEALCSGTIRPGEILSESQLAEEMGMSRTPVREALRALASEDWLEIKNGVGAYVKPLSAKDMEDLYEIRCLLEVQAAKTSVYYITNEEIDELDQQFRSLFMECERGDSPEPKRFSVLDWKLHELIVERCQNNYIKVIMRNNNSNMRRYQYLSAEALHDIRESTLQHLKILELLRNRDAEALEDALHRHLVWAAGILKRPR